MYWVRNCFVVCEELRQKGYEFIFSIHPKEYQRYDEQIEPLGEKVEACRKRGMLVRSPQQDWLPYMMASDVVLIIILLCYLWRCWQERKLFRVIFQKEKYGRDPCMQHCERYFR